MIFKLQEYKRRAILPFAGLVLAGYYVLVFLPLAHHTRGLDAPLQQQWNGLALSLGLTNTDTLDFQRITNQLSQTRQALARLQEARKKAAARFDLGSALRAKMNPPFQLYEFEYERGKRRDELAGLAKARQVALDAPVLDGLPEYTLDVRQPALLWPALAMVNGFLNLAVESKVSAIHCLESSLAFTNAWTPSSASPSSSSGSAAARVAPIPFQVELTGPVAGVLRLLQGLPLREEELRAVGFTNAPAGKLPLLLDRLIIRKQSPDKPDEVRVALRLVGFVFQDWR